MVFGFFLIKIWVAKSASHKFLKILIFQKHKKKQFLNLNFANLWTQIVALVNTLGNRLNKKMQKVKQCPTSSEFIVRCFLHRFFNIIWRKYSCKNRTRCTFICNQSITVLRNSYKFRLKYMCIHTAIYLCYCESIVSVQSACHDSHKTLFLLNLKVQQYVFKLY